MKIQTRILLLLGLIMGLNLLLLGVQLRSTFQRADALYQNALEDKQKVFSRIVELKGKPIENLARDYTFWDDMVEFAETGKVRGKKDWATENIDPALSAFEVNAAWVVRTDGKIAYAATSLEDDDAVDMKQLLFPPEVFKQLAENRFNHFFYQTKNGLMEVRGATIHPTADSERQTRPRGFFLVGGLWNEQYLGEISHLTDSKLRLIEADKEESVKKEEKREQGVIAFTKPLLGYNGAAAAILKVESEVPYVKLLNDFMSSRFWMQAGLSIFLLIILAVAVVAWVTRPLQLISGALSSGETELLEGLSKQRTEIGAVSELVASSVKQKLKVEEEKSALMAKSEELERFNRLMVKRELRMASLKQQLKALKEKKIK